MISSIFCCFFFQAEDGIRDLTVTGVQTCALPISMWKAYLALFNQTHWMITRDVERHYESLQKTQWLSASDLRELQDEKLRSEERRVGKECRSRWSEYD